MKDKKILIVDDVFQIRHNLTQFFSECGYFAFNASCGAGALETCEKTTPDLIILDYNLRDMDCFQFLEKLRKYENGLKDVVRVKDIPVIIISGYLTEEKVALVAQKYGICGYLHKPLNLNELLKMAEPILGSTRKIKVDKTRNIIVLDSEIRTAKFIAGHLGQFNINATICLGPFDYIEMATEIRPDMVIFDCFINFEMLDKFDLYAITSEYNPQAKFILTTFCPSCRMTSTFKYLGYPKIITKPIDLLVLESEVVGAFKKPADMIKKELKTIQSPIA